MLKTTAVNLIRLYQEYLRNSMPVSCRFTPTCSEYAKQAILKYGFFKGCYKAARRLLCCQPFSGKEGYNPLV